MRRFAVIGLGKFGGTVAQIQERILNLIGADKVVLAGMAELVDAHG